MLTKLNLCLSCTCTVIEVLSICSTKSTSILFSNLVPNIANKISKVVYYDLLNVKAVNNKITNIEN